MIVSMVERVASAIGAELPDGSRFDNYLLHAARAAIKASREPTPAMLAAGTGFWNTYQTDIIFDTGDAEACWQAMIDEALNASTPLVPTQGCGRISSDELQGRAA